MKLAEDFILNQPEPFKSILLHLQLIIEHNFSQLDLQFKWKIPFYCLEGSPFCYLNPSKKKGYVDVGFYGEKPLSKYNELLISEGRKVVRSLRYKSIDEIDANILVFVLTESNTIKEKGFWKK